MASLNARAWFALVALAVVMGLLLFVPAGTTHYWQAWVYLLIFFGASLLTTVYLLKNDPALLERRMHGGPIAEKEPTQKIIRVHDWVQNVLEPWQQATAVSLVLPLPQAATAGEHRKVRVAFPADYAVADLAGKDADFDVDVKEVRRRLPIGIDDELGQAVGLENLAELRQELRQRLQRDYDAASRLRLKRSLLDKLAEGHDFPVPPGMVDLEFDNIWGQYEARKEAPPAVAGAEAIPVAGEAGTEAIPAAGEAGDDAIPTAVAPGGAGQSEEAARAEYRRIAERRVRLGLLLAEVGSKNNITVTPDEVNQAITREARRHPGHERRVLDFYRQNPGTIDALRAPIFEDKVIDFIVELAKIEERKVTPQELLAIPDPAGEV